MRCICSARFTNSFILNPTGTCPRPAMRVDYVPPPLPDDVDILFKSAVHKGINFDRWVVWFNRELEHHYALKIEFMKARAVFAWNHWIWLPMLTTICRITEALFIQAWPRLLLLKVDERPSIAQDWIKFKRNPWLKSGLYVYATLP